jgi:hypothetical protein
MKHAILIAAALAMAGMATGAQAGWRADHPRRAEVNARLANQAHRINVERREGEISAGQAHDLHVQDRGIRAQERYDASRNGGHLTRAEQVQLNHEENQVSHEIGR